VNYVVIGCSYLVIGIFISDHEYKNLAKKNIVENEKFEEKNNWGTNLEI
jgi:hypothetical protein